MVGVGLDHMHMAWMQGAACSAEGHREATPSDGMPAPQECTATGDNTMDATAVTSKAFQ